MTGFGVLAIGAFALGSCAPACWPVEGPAPAPAVVICGTDHGYLVNGVLTVTVLRTEAVPCDMIGGQSLNLVYNGETEGEGWGGDASVARAAADCDDHGGLARWYNDGDYRLVCEDVDY